MFWRPQQDIDRLGTGIDPSIHYPGKVVNNADPLKLSRVRVRVVEFHGESEVPDSQLPWARQLRPTSIGSKTGGWFGVPQVDTEVEIRFPRGDVYNPEYLIDPVHELSKVGVHVREENYGRVFGFSAPEGKAYLMFNIETGEIYCRSVDKVTFEVDGTFDIRAGDRITFDSDTGVTLTAPDFAMIRK